MTTPTVWDTILALSPEWATKGDEASGTTLVDFSGNGRNGTIDAGVSLGQTKIVPNAPGTAWDLNAFEGGSVPGASWMGASTFTGIVFFRLTAFDTDGTVVLARSDVGTGNSKTAKAWAIIVTSTGALQGRAYNEAGTTVNPASSNNVIELNRLYMLTVWYDGTNLRFYVAGGQWSVISNAASSALAGPPVTFASNSKPITIGRSDNTSGSSAIYTATGKIQGAAFWSSALSVANLDAIWASARTTFYTETIQADAPLVHLRGGESSGNTITDISGNARGGATLSGTFTRNAAALLSTDASPSTDFATAFAQMAHASWMNVSALTVEAWINGDTYGAGDRTIAQIDDDASPATEQMFRLRVSNGLPVLVIRTAAGATTLTGATTLSTGTTYHIAATYDGTDAKIYVNGVLDGSVTISSALQAGTANLFLGSLGAFNSARFDGRIQDFAMYGTALSGARVQDHYDAGSTGNQRRDLGGPIVETDLARALTPVATGLFQIGRASETDEARSLTPVFGGVQVDLGRVAETDIAQPLALGVGQDGSWSWWTSPRAVAIDGKVFVGSAGSQDGNIYVDEYDASALGAKLNVRYNVATVAGGFDDHNTPALFLEPGKAPIVIWQRHAADSILRVSVGTQPIESGFTFDATPTSLSCLGSVTYTVLHVAADGTIYAVFRSTSSKWAIRASTDDGATWGTEARILSHADQVYMASKMGPDGRIRCAATAHPRFSTGQSIYYAELDPATGILYKRDGTVIGTLNSTGYDMTTTWEVIAVPTSGWHTWVYDVSDGPDVEVTWVQMSTPDNPTNGVYEYTTDAAGSWATEEIVAAGLPFGDEAASDDGGNYHGGVQFAQPGSVVVSREDSGTWYVEYWHTTDGGVTWDTDVIVTSTTKRLARAWKVEERDGTNADWVAVNVITPPFSSYVNHDGRIALFPAPALPDPGAAIELGRVVETDSTFTLGVAGTFAVTLGRASENDAAQLLAVSSPISVTLGLAEETDEAFALTPALGGLTTALSQAVEVDEARTLTNRVAFTLGLAEETDEVFGFVVGGPPQDLGIGQASEVSSLTPMSIAMPLATVIDAFEVAMPLTVVLGEVAAELGRVAETSETSSLVVEATFQVPVGRADETDSIAPMGLVLGFGQGQTVEVPLPLAVAGSLSIELARVGEGEETFALMTVLSLVQEIGRVSEVDTVAALALTATLAVELARVGEANAALTIAVMRSIVRVRIWYAGEEKGVELLGVMMDGRVIPAHAEYWTDGRIIQFERELAP